LSELHKTIQLAILSAYPGRINIIAYHN
jgi:hypothetical protein